LKIGKAPKPFLFSLFFIFSANAESIAIILFHGHINGDNDYGIDHDLDVGFPYTTTVPQIRPGPASFTESIDQIIDLPISPFETPATDLRCTFNFGGLRFVFLPARWRGQVYNVRLELPGANRNKD
jgi:hypothetical protein